MSPLASLLIRALIPGLRILLIVHAHLTALRHDKLRYATLFIPMRYISIRYIPIRYVLRRQPLHYIASLHRAGSVSAAVSGWVWK